MIKIKNLIKSFDKNEVLKDINLEVHKGEVVSIIGPSGSGKSTLLRCMNLLEQPTDGHVIFEGKELTSKDVNLNELRQNMGMVFQSFNLFPHKTVLENIYMAPKLLKKGDLDTLKKEAHNLLEKVADAFNFDTLKNNTFNKDRALVELNYAVYHSFKSQGVSIVDHLTASKQFELFQQKEAQAERQVTGKWSWLAPPLSPTLTDNYHHGFNNEMKDPNFYYKKNKTTSCPFH
ncbi:MAG: nitric oxide synthase oxygenase [Staphylococcus lugdunensis]|nr:nitric oxide synthase oxygenase [Staphylococcus lugdunensis]